MKPRDYSRPAPTPDDLRLWVVEAHTVEPAGRCCAKCTRLPFNSECGNTVCKCHRKGTR